MTYFSQLSGSEVTNEVDSPAIPGHAPAPPWLTDLRHLVPLQVAFEEEVKEKDAVIAAYDKEIKSVRVKTAALIRENEEMASKLAKFASVSGVDPDHQVMVSENASLVQAENDLLKEKVSKSSNTLELLSNGGQR